MKKSELRQLIREELGNNPSISPNLRISPSKAEGFWLINPSVNERLFIGDEDVEKLLGYLQNYL